MPSHPGPGAFAIAPEEAAAVLAADRALLEALAAATAPTDQQLVDLARLIQRYRLPLQDPTKEPAACSRLRALADQALLRWGLSEPLLFERTRAIWAAGFRPQLAFGEEAVGSGSDVAAE